MNSYTLGKRNMLSKINLVELLKKRNIEDLSDDFYMPEALINKEYKSQLSKASFDIKYEYDEISDPMLGIGNAWMYSKEREYLKLKSQLKTKNT